MRLTRSEQSDERRPAAEHARPDPQGEAAQPPVPGRELGGAGITTVSARRVTARRRPRRCVTGVAGVDADRRVDRLALEHRGAAAGLPWPRSIGARGARRDSGAPGSPGSPWRPAIVQTLLAHWVRPPSRAVHASQERRACPTTTPGRSPRGAARRTPRRRRLRRRHPPAVKRRGGDGVAARHRRRPRRPQRRRHHGGDPGRATRSAARWAPRSSPPRPRRGPAGPAQPRAPRPGRAQRRRRAGRRGCSLAWAGLPRRPPRCTRGPR